MTHIRRRKTPFVTTHEPPSSVWLGRFHPKGCYPYKTRLAGELVFIRCAGRARGCFAEACALSSNKRFWGQEALFRAPRLEFWCRGVYFLAFSEFPDLASGRAKDGSVTLPNKLLHTGSIDLNESTLRKFYFCSLEVDLACVFGRRACASINLTRLLCDPASCYYHCYVVRHPAAIELPPPKLCTINPKLETKETHEKSKP